MMHNSIKCAKFFHVGYFIWSSNGPVSHIEEEQAQRSYLGREQKIVKSQDTGF